MKKAEVAEALIATWCIEFLRIRKFGGFHVVEILVISVLMMGVKTVIFNRARRHHNAKHRSYPMQNGDTQLQRVGRYRNPARSNYRPRYPRFD